MDRLAALAAELTAVIEQLQREATRADARELTPPLAWLDEANQWLAYELRQRRQPDGHDSVPITYIPVDLRRA